MHACIDLERDVVSDVVFPMTGTAYCRPVIICIGSRTYDGYVAHTAVFLAHHAARRSTSVQVAFYIQNHHPDGAVLLHLLPALVLLFALRC